MLFAQVVPRFAPSPLPPHPRFMPLPLGGASSQPSRAGGSLPATSQQPRASAQPLRRRPCKPAPWQAPRARACCRTASCLLPPRPLRRLPARLPIKQMSHGRHQASPSLLCIDSPQRVAAMQGVQAGLSSKHGRAGRKPLAAGGPLGACWLCGGAMQRAVQPNSGSAQTVTCPRCLLGARVLWQGGRDSVAGAVRPENTRPTVPSL